MFKKNSSRLLLLAAITVTTITSCKKEDVLAPNEQPSNENSTVIYVRAVDKDSSAVESQQIVLR